MSFLRALSLAALLAVAPFQVDAQVAGQAGQQPIQWPGGAAIDPVVNIPTGGGGYGYAVGDTIQLFCPNAVFATWPTVTVASVEIGRAHV